MKQSYDLIVFDWDGTLIDSIGWIVKSLKQAAYACGLGDPSDAAARSVIGLELGEAMRTLFPGISTGQEGVLVDAYQDHYYTRHLGPDDFFEGVPFMLAALKERGYRLAVATGKARVGLNHVMDATGAHRWFDASRCSDETASKPHPRMLLELMAAMGASPERTVMVGDSVHDMKMAVNAGVAAVGVACGANSRAELMAHEPRLCLEQTAELLDLLV